MYPGYFGRRDLNNENLGAHIAQSVAALAPKIEREMEDCLCYGRERESSQRESSQRESSRSDIGDCAPRARELTQVFLRRLPEIRKLLLRDVQAAFDGDPAATNLDEVILAYPGLLAVSVYRIAHALYDLGVPMMARIMTEWAHSRTGCDIHPGANIGAAFFIDHATGVVIGETTDIGEGVKLYQGVTLGALSFPRDATGQIIRGKKRHPTVESGSTLYANATVLGGQTVVGADSVIGGSVFLTRSVPPRSRVSLKEPELRVATRDGAAEPDAIYFDI
jgi:serine O-acetyltransferase